MATVNKTFTSVEPGDNLFIKSGDKMDYSVSGSFVGTVIIEQSSNNEQTWTQVGDPITGAASSTINTYYGGSNHGLYRFRCIDYTSGSIVTSLTDAALVLKEYKDADGNTILKITEAGIEVNGDVVINDDDSFLEFSDYTIGAWSITENEWGDFGSFTLTKPGIYNIASILAMYGPNGSGALRAYCDLAIGEVSGNDGTGLVPAKNRAKISMEAPGATDTYGMLTIPDFRVEVTDSPVTLYMKGRMQINSANWLIVGRRMTATKVG